MFANLISNLLQDAPSSSHILSLITFTPLLGMIAILCIPKAKTEVIKTTAAAATLLPLVLAFFLYVTLDWTQLGPEQLAHIERYSWIETESFKIQYFLGIDGISAPILLLSTLLFFVAVFSSWTISKGPRAISRCSCCSK
jgi:NADH-quinone oxidoreductase subunit M